MAQTDFLHIIKSRGFLHQCTDEENLVAAYKTTPKLPAYVGYDCTGPSLHVGHLLPTMALRWWQKCGGTAIVLLGGGTSKIGDPSGKDSARPLMDDAAIYANMASIRTVFPKLLGDNVVYVDNDEWLKHLSYVDFLREYGNMFSINRMLRNKSVQLRMEREQEMSLIEFNYMLFQAYDYAELYKNYRCRLQMGGSDQWGNIVQGVELQRRIGAGKSEELFGLTTPLITTASGAKMGKTAAGAVWLNADLCSPYDYWQFWRNTEDADVGKFLKLFTELDVEECERLGALEGAQINEAKKILATEATALLHGREAAEKAAATAQETFESGGTATDLPEIVIARAALEAGMAVYKLFHVAGLAASGGEARRLIAGKGARINDEVIDNSDRMVTVSDMHEKGFIKLSSGKKKHVLVKAE